jgi:hypothetical protein
MLTKNAFLRLSLGGEISPTLAWPNLSGNHFLGTDITLTYPQATGVFSARLYFGDTSQTAVIRPTGDITPTTVGARQSFTFGGIVDIYQPGVSSAGLLPVICKWAPGVQITYQVPLNPTSHNTAAAVYKAIIAFIAPQIEAQRRVNLSINAAGEITATRLYPAANDLTWFSMSTPGVLGLAVGNSVPLQAGVPGMVVERLGPNLKDIYGDALPGDRVKVWYLSSPDYSGGTGPGTISSPQFGNLKPGGFTVQSSPNLLVDNLTCTGSACILDVLAIQDRS